MFRGLGLQKKWGHKKNGARLHFLDEARSLDVLKNGVKKNGDRPHFLDVKACRLNVLKKNGGTWGSKRCTLGPSTGEYRASIKKVSYRWQKKA